MSAHSTATILLVEDEPITRLLTRALFEKRGCRVHEAENGLEAMTLLRGGLRPDVILLDLMMPVMDGREFYWLQQADPTLADIPVVILSASVTVHAEAVSMGVVAYLQKPAEAETILETVCRHLEPLLVP